MKFDLHMHTTRHSPDSQMDPLDMLRRAREIGLDGLVITEHDWLWTEEELDELRAAAPDLVVLAGVEVSTRQGHFLSYGVTNPFKIAAGIDVASLCREVHRQGGAVVAAHPFRWGQRFHDILRKDKPDLDGLELMSSNMDADCRRRAAEVQGLWKFAGLGCSDAHHENTLGACYTVFDAAIRDSRDLVEAIRGRRSTAVDRLAAEAW
jgi:predicted metal-dependent phosphoesterase TrpH